MRTLLKTSSMKCSALAALLVMLLSVPPVGPRDLFAETSTDQPAVSVINFIGHETTKEKTRVIFHANAPIDYRGGLLRKDQVILDLANVTTSLPTTVVELGAPEVDRVVIGPEITRYGENVLKVRLTGVHASTHKVETKENELFIDLTPAKGARNDEGLPKVIDNSSEVMARNESAETPEETAPIKWAKATPVEAKDAGGDPAPLGGTATEENAVFQTEGDFVAVAAGPPVVSLLEPEAMIPTPVAEPEPEVVQASAPMPEASMPAVAMPAAEPVAEMAPAAPLYNMSSGTEGAGSGKSLKVMAGRSITLRTDVPVKRVSVSNPAVAEPIAISPSQLLINGLAPGVVSLVLWPQEGDPIEYDLTVSLDTAHLAQRMQAIFPRENVRVHASKDSLVLSGKVSSPEVGEKLVQMASDYSSKVINDLQGPNESRRQVMLKVMFAEVNKTAMTELGAVLHHVDPTNPLGNDRGSSGTGEFAPPSGNLINNPVGPDFTWGDAINLSFFEKTIDLGMFITALKSRGLFQELAEPTLIAADGESANFLAGGEFPVPVAQPGANFTSITVEWKKFGISLDFKPTIREDEVIIMKVRPEVSSLDFSNGVLLEGFRLPSLVVRRAETEVELRSGQAFAIAGLYDRNLLQTKSKIPILGDIPLLKYLFRSKNLAKKRTELLVIVTPTIVEPLSSIEHAPKLEMPESFDLDKKKKSKGN